MANLDDYQAPAVISRWRTLALGAGGIASLAWGVGTYLNPEQGLRSWLLGFIFWAGITFGSLGVLMLQYLTGGAWGVVIRRTLEAATRTLPLVILLFIPLALGVYFHTFMEFTHMAESNLPVDVHIMEARGIYMAPWFWIVRSAIYFAAFGVHGDLQVSRDRRRAVRARGLGGELRGGAVVALGGHGRKQAQEGRERCERSARRPHDPSARRNVMPGAWTQAPGERRQNV